MAAAVGVAACLGGCARRSTPVRVSPAELAYPATMVARPEQLQPAQVRLLQRALMRQGRVVLATGTFDAATHEALLAFQRDQDLAETGDVNGATALALGIAPERLAPRIETGAAGD